MYYIYYTVIISMYRYSISIISMYYGILDFNLDFQLELSPLFSILIFYLPICSLYYIYTYILYTVYSIIYYSIYW